MANQTGTYFRDLYADIVKQLPQFPTNDPSPNLQECIRDDYVNFVRAEMLAKKHNLPSDVVTHLQELALMQYFKDYDNLTGFEKLIQEYKITPNNRARIVLLSLKENNYPCFHFTQHTLDAIDDNQAGIYAGSSFSRVKKEAKPNCISRFIAWLKSPFKKT